MLTVAGDTDIVTFDGCDVFVIVTVAVPALVASFSDVATITTCAGVGTVVGAVYKPVLEIVPFALPPDTVQVTAVLNVSCTLALNCCVFPITMLTPVGSTLTETTFPAVPVLHPPIRHTKANAISDRAALVALVRRFVTMLGGTGKPSRQSYGGGLIYQTCVNIGCFGGLSG